MAAIPTAAATSAGIFAVIPTSMAMAAHGNTGAYGLTMDDVTPVANGEEKAQHQ